MSVIGHLDLLIRKIAARIMANFTLRCSKTTGTESLRPAGD
ncbi:hypothetical protein HMPREF0208_02976 [Citrobacter koseri]|nr:hypothetical protein HMPREF3207_04651 [Citrobacter koseri]KWZ99649.1 hypothetical protein HMPREF3220_02071 [Citrobacter koseri]KXB42754.1 hypothetical protein HMPREF0208_02976 [Citrobacter koseri]